MHKYTKQFDINKNNIPDIIKQMDKQYPRRDIMYNMRVMGRAITISKDNIISQADKKTGKITFTNKRTFKLSATISFNSYSNEYFLKLYHRHKQGKLKSTELMPIPDLLDSVHFNAYLHQRRSKRGLPITNFIYHGNRFKCKYKIFMQDVLDDFGEYHREYFYRCKSQNDDGSWHWVEELKVNLLKKKTPQERKKFAISLYKANIPVSFIAKIFDVKDRTVQYYVKGVIKDIDKKKNNDNRCVLMKCNCGCGGYASIGKKFINGHSTIKRHKNSVGFQKRKFD